MMTEEQKQALIKHNIAKINSITPQFMKEALPGVKRHLQCEIDSAKLALDSLRAALTQPASQSENVRHDALCDTNYARGVAHGWNLAQNGDSEGMRKCIESRTTAAMSALAQPAIPALKLPGKGCLADTSDKSLLDWQDGWNACLAEVKRLNVPHTAPIEPICATGGVKVPEGWSLVPNEATREMIEEGDQWELSENIWNAMIGVAPKP